MRILLTSWGSYGDLFPYIGLAQQLLALGHAPVLATCPFHRPMVERAGVEFRPLRPDVDPSRTDLLARVMDPAHGSEVIIRELIMPAMSEQYEDVTAAAASADVIVSHPVTFATPLVAERLGRRWLSTVLAPLSFFSIHDFPALPPFAALVAIHRVGGSWTGALVKSLAHRVTREWTSPVRALRANIGLPPAADPLYEGQFSPFGTLALFSRVMGSPQPDWPPHTRVTGFVFYNGPDADPPADLAAFVAQGDPPLVFTLGSSAVGAAGDFYEVSAAASHAVGRRAVLLVGRSEQNRPPTLPDDVIAVEYAPHDWLFPRAAATVHHGGVGTTGQALRSGRPMLVVPFAHDQPDNAHRVQKLGVSRTISPKQYRCDAVVPHLRALLDDRRYADRAAEIGRTVRSEPGGALAAEIIASAAGRAGS